MTRYSSSRQGIVTGIEEVSIAKVYLLNHIDGGIMAVAFPTSSGRLQLFVLQGMSPPYEFDTMEECVSWTEFSRNRSGTRGFGVQYHARAVYSNEVKETADA